MINFKELVKERDAAKLRIDEINSRIDNIRHNEGIVPHTLNQELISTEEYHKQLILRIGRSLTEENVAVPVTVVTLGKEDLEESTKYKEISNWVENTTNKLISGEFIITDGKVNKEEVEKLKQETPLATFNPADTLQAITGIGVSEESAEVDEEQCGCKDCTSEDDDNAEDTIDTIIKAFLLKSAINAIQAKKEGK